MPVIDIEKMARDAGIDDCAALTPYMLQRLSAYTALVLEEATNSLAQELAQRETDDCDDLTQQGCIDHIRTLSRQLSEVVI